MLWCLVHECMYRGFIKIKDNVGVHGASLAPFVITMYTGAVDPPGCYQGMLQAAIRVPNGNALHG